jgi:hypothetical protein
MTGAFQSVDRQTNRVPGCVRVFRDVPPKKNENLGRTKRQMNFFFQKIENFCVDRAGASLNGNLNEFAYF